MFRNHEGGITQVIDGVRNNGISHTVYRLMYAAMARLNMALGSRVFQHYLGSTAWALQWLRCQDQVWTTRKKVQHLCFYEGGVVRLSRKLSNMYEFWDCFFLQRAAWIGILLHQVA